MAQGITRVHEVGTKVYSMGKTHSPQVILDRVHKIDKMLLYMCECKMIESHIKNM